jgi:hypothetical protein
VFLHVVAHTHWDREWYHTAERFRQKLVALVDELIDDPPVGDESFLLDGQTIVLDDYLAVRPDRASEIRELLRARRLEAGPWFVLADELIPSGEALVRNLLTGRRTLRRIGVEAPPVLYCPDSFGHPAALPSIAAGFGLPLIILWRGYGGARWPKGDVVRWVAPAGDKALVYHLPRDGYEFGSHLPRDTAGAEARWTRIRDELAPRSTTGIELIPNGADHHARQPGQRDAVAALAAAAAREDVRASSLRAFSEALVTAARAVDVPTIRGELRDSYGYTWTLQGTFATRAHEKRMNARAERLLLRETEPWSALAAQRGSSKRPLVEAAWRTLLEAHPHDTLCGCSIDEVAEAMELRIQSAVNQATGVRDDAIAQLIGHDPVEARESRDRWSPMIIVRNPTARPRGGVAIVEIARFIADVGVGPGSAAVSNVAKARMPEPLLANLGRSQGLSFHFTHSLTESPRHYPDNDLVNVTTQAIWVDPIPAYGLAVVAEPTTRPSRDVTRTGSSIENAYSRVVVDHVGRISLTDLASGRCIDALIELIDETDAGDTYTPAPRSAIYSFELKSTGHRRHGPLMADIELRYNLRRDLMMAVDADVSERRIERTAQSDAPFTLDSDAGITEIVVRLLLEADAPFVRVEIDGENRLEDHRLRLRFRTDVTRGDVYADAAFGPVVRAPLAVPREDMKAEVPPKTAPLHRYVSRFDERQGCTVFSDGLAEYEAEDDGSVVITLLRAVGELSVRDLPERPGHAGWPKRTPGAQCLRQFAGSFAFLLHGPRSPDTIDAIERTADDVLLPLRGSTLRSALHVPEPVVGVELHGVGLAVSAIKESEDGRSLVLRCVNLLDEPTAGSWRVPFDVTEARRARLDEAPIEPLTTIDRVISFAAQPREIITILVTTA